MELVSPGIGLIFWMTLAFGVVLYILGKFAWKPILKSLKDRENSIDQALHEADKARQEMKALKFSNEELMADAKEERDSLLKQAREIKEKLIEDARVKANEEANRIIESARETIENEKMAAMVDLKNQIARLSIEIAEKVLEHELDDKSKQKEYVDLLIKKANLN
ncbi:MAG: F0F1 ATP synthase subunit B [Bacteroidales bacterium]|nr:F0F1 ATP synthase subunit B [Bacteroidales bacterium]